jgi:quinol-cytochrome oxidoreductase complex cytochrome b subunit
LRAIPNKLAGVRAIGLVFLSLALLPYMHKPAVRGPNFQQVHKKVVIVLIADCFLLTFLGSMPVEPPYVLLGQMRTRLFFLCIALLCIAAWADSY